MDFFLLHLKFSSNFIFTLNMFAIRFVRIMKINICSISELGGSWIKFTYFGIKLYYIQYYTLIFSISNTTGSIYFAKISYILTNIYVISRTEKPVGKSYIRSMKDRGSIDWTLSFFGNTTY